MIIMDKPWTEGFPCYQEADWSLIPEHMHHGVMLYVEDGIPHMGSFLRAIMTKAPWNEVLGLADTENQQSMLGWAIFCTSYLPFMCWGSDDAVHSWIKLGGMKGLYEAELSHAETSGAK